MSNAIRLMRFADAVERDPAVDAWFERRAGELGAIARPWQGIWVLAASCVL